MTPEQMRQKTEPKEKKEPLFTMDEVCKLLKVERRTMCDWVQYRKIPYVKLDNKHIRFRISEIEQWVRKQQSAHRKKYQFQ